MFPQQSASPDAYATAADVQAGQVSGVGYAVSVETGLPVPVYVNDTPTALPVPVQPAPVQQVVVQAAARDPWPARILASGGTLAGVTVAVGHYAPQLGQLGHAVQAAGIGIGLAAAGLYVLKGAAPKLSVTINSSITGANASSAASSNAKSAAGWKNQA